MLKTKNLTQRTQRKTKKTNSRKGAMMQRKKIR